jgi:hypothetical protein
VQTYSATPALEKLYREDDKYKEWTRRYMDGRYEMLVQRYLVVRALVDAKRPCALDYLFNELNTPQYKATVKHKTRDGEPDPDSWFEQKAGGIRGSIKYHLKKLLNEGLIR